MENKEVKNVETKTVEKEAPKQGLFKKISDLIKNKPYIPIVILVILLLIALLIPKRLPSIFRTSNSSKIEKICQLATVEAYYHNVADRDKDATSIGEFFGNIGYKRYWIEYDAIIQYGIDAKKVRIEKPNIKNEVKIYIPEAEVLGEPKVIDGSIQDPITDTGFLTSIKPEEKNLAVEDSIKTLKEKAGQNAENFELARKRAETFFENYIVNVGKEIGTTYKVIFIDE